MNIHLGKQLETLVQDQIQSGLYANQSEVIRDALRHTFAPGEDADDTALLAEKLREGMAGGPGRKHCRGDISRRVQELIRQHGQPKR